MAIVGSTGLLVVGLGGTARAEGGLGGGSNLNGSTAGWFDSATGAGGNGQAGSNALLIILGGGGGGAGITGGSGGAGYGGKMAVSEAGTRANRVLRACPPTIRVQAGGVAEVVPTAS